ncbi:phosphate-starvation-inducible PsiE family protein [bacterium]|nr:phosphate-starvation-inducible PsiE family protein [bacterium]MBU1993495.1 phosphate-starvation-inducible PsiE family protein [bacterium]
MVNSRDDAQRHEELPTEHEDALIAFLHKVIKIAVKILAVLMVLVIFWGVGDVVYVLYNNLKAPPFMLLSISDIFKTFAAFLAVLIAIEIYQNIVLYLRTDVIPIKLVVATALMAIARKVIIIDFATVTPMYIFSTAAVVLALGITYYLVGQHHKERLIEERK